MPESFSRIGQAEINGVPVLIIYAVVVAVIAHVLLDYDLRVVGAGDRRQSRGVGNSGINVRAAVHGGLHAERAVGRAAGMLMTARLGSGQPSIGNGMELQVISAVIIGGTSLFGGIGTILGTLLGSLVLSVLTTGMILLRSTRCCRTSSSA